MKKLALLCCLLLTMGATSAFASMSGTLYANGGAGYTVVDTSGGLVGINAVVGCLTWTVDQLESGLWDYTYTVTPYTTDKPRGIGSFNIEFGSQPTDLTWDYTYLSGTITNPDMYDATTDGTVSAINRTLAGSVAPYTYDSWLLATNPLDTSVNVDTIFQGISWIIDDSSPNGSQSVTLHLTTSLAPTWGNIYMDGYNMTSNNGYGMLRNTNYDLDFTGTFVYLAEGFDYATSAFVGWVVTPGAASVPVPASLLLFASGLGSLFIVRRRTVAC